MLPLSPPYDAVTAILCGATWGYNSIYGAPRLCDKLPGFCLPATSHDCPELASQSAEPASGPKT